MSLFSYCLLPDDYNDQFLFFLLDKTTLHGQTVCRVKFVAELTHCLLCETDEGLEDWTSHAFMLVCGAALEHNQCTSSFLPTKRL
jgi:hypothetical protein